jgi:hypothetical protein
MSLRARALAITIALLAVPCGVALAKMVPAGAPPPPPVTHYRGSDSAGRVRFTLHNISYVGAPLFITGLRFASACTEAGTVVDAKITVDRKTYDFHVSTGGVTVSGSFHGKFQKSASGTVSVKTTSCHSGPLKFTASTG